MSSQRHTRVRTRLRQYERDLSKRLKAWALQVIDEKITLENAALACAEWHMQMAQRSQVPLAVGRARELYDRAYGDIAALVATIQQGYNPHITIKQAQTHQQAIMPTKRLFALQTCWGCGAPSVVIMTMRKDEHESQYPLCSRCGNDIPTAKRIAEHFDQTYDL